MASLTDLPGTAAQILALFSAQLRAQNVELPERQYRAPASMVVWDGEQLTVCLMGVASGQPGMALSQTVIPAGQLFYATFAVTLVRKVAIVQTDGFAAMEIPSAEDADSDGAMTMTDAQELIAAASAIHQAYALTGVGEGFVIDGLQPLGPEGGLVGSRLLISLSVS